MSTTDLSAERAILHWAADRIDAEPAADRTGEGERAAIVADLRLWAATLAAPTTYALPPEPPESVTELWDGKGRRWERQDVLGHVRWFRQGSDGSAFYHVWRDLLALGPLSTVPPEQTEAGS